MFTLPVTISLGILAEHHKEGAIKVKYFTCFLWKVKWMAKRSRQFIWKRLSQGEWWSKSEQGFQNCICILNNICIRSLWSRYMYQKPDQVLVTLSWTEWRRPEWYQFASTLNLCINWIVKSRPYSISKVQTVSNVQRKSCGIWINNLIYTLLIKYNKWPIIHRFVFHD